MLLSFADVRITPNTKSGCVKITTTNDCYDLVRSILLELKESAGLPVSLHSEETAALILKLSRTSGGDGTVGGLTNVEPPRTEGNEFIIPAWQINVCDKSLSQLAIELKQRFESSDLSVKVFEN